MLIRQSPASAPAAIAPSSSSRSPYPPLHRSAGTQPFAAPGERRGDPVGPVEGAEQAFNRPASARTWAAGEPPAFELIQGPHRVAFARSREEVESALRLRYEVFNLELGEGLQASERTGLDEDRFDQACHHLLVQSRGDGRVVGTYRMQTFEMAARSRWFYSAGEFDLCDLPLAVLEQSVEVGRACVAREFRNRHALFLLWRGLAAFMRWSGKRYLFGCSSLTSQDPAQGLAALRHLTTHGHLHPFLHVEPLPSKDCRRRPERPGDGKTGAEAREVRIPILFGTYLRYGAKVLGPPALDLDFKTIDFLTLLDLHDLAAETRRLFLPEAAPWPARGEAQGVLP